MKEIKTEIVNSYLQIMENKFLCINEELARLRTGIGSTVEEAFEDYKNNNQQEDGEIAYNFDYDLIDGRLSFYKIEPVTVTYAIRTIHHI